MFYVDCPSAPILEAAPSNQGLLVRGVATVEVGDGDITTTKSIDVCEFEFAALQHYLEFRDGN